MVLEGRKGGRAEGREGLGDVEHLGFAGAMQGGAGNLEPKLRGEVVDGNSTTAFQKQSNPVH
jgi:hypothetical protein